MFTPNQRKIIKVFYRLIFTALSTFKLDMFSEHQAITHGGKQVSEDTFNGIIFY